MEAMDRREAVRRVATMFGGFVIAGRVDLFALPDPAAPRRGQDLFSAQDVATLDELAETILPATAKSPGAKAAKTGAFMVLMVTDCFDPADQEVFRRGLKALDLASVTRHGVPFSQASADQRLALAERFDREAHAAMQRETDGPPHWFRMMKELACVGFFTSEVGMTQALRYMETPGRFDPCAPYTPGDPAWADHA